MPVTIPTPLGAPPRKPRGAFETLLLGLVQQAGSVGLNRLINKPQQQPLSPQQQAVMGEMQNAQTQLLENPESPTSIELSGITDEKERTRLLSGRLNQSVAELQQMADRQQRQDQETAAATLARLEDDDPLNDPSRLEVQAAAQGAGLPATIQALLFKEQTPKTQAELLTDVGTATLVGLMSQPGGIDIPALADEIQSNPVIAFAISNTALQSLVTAEISNRRSVAAAFRNSAITFSRDNPQLAAANVSVATVTKFLRFGLDKLSDTEQAAVLRSGLIQDLETQRQGAKLGVFASLLRANPAFSFGAALIGKNLEDGDAEAAAQSYNSFRKLALQLTRDPELIESILPRAGVERAEPGWFKSVVQKLTNAIAGPVGAEAVDFGQKSFTILAGAESQAAFSLLAHPDNRDSSVAGAIALAKSNQSRIAAQAREANLLQDPEIQDRLKLFTAAIQVLEDFKSGKLRIP